MEVTIKNNMTLIYECNDLLGDLFIFVVVMPKDKNVLVYFESFFID